MNKTKVILAVLTGCLMISFMCSQYFRYFTYDTPAVYNVAVNERHMADLDHSNQKVLKIISDEEPFELRIEVVPTSLINADDESRSRLTRLTQETCQSLKPDAVHAKRLQRQNVSSKSMSDLKVERTGDSIEYAMWLQALLEQNGYPAEIVYGHVLGQHYFHFWIQTRAANGTRVFLDPYHNKTSLDNRYLRLSSDQKPDVVLQTMRNTRIGIERINW